MDGAMGTYYSRLKKEESSIPELAIFVEPDFIRDIHLEYIDAGARLIRTNTFAANTKLIQMNELEQRQLILKACEVAKSAAAIAQRNGLKEQVWIGGSIGPIARQMASNEEEMVEEYKRMCNTLLEGKVDAIIFETFDDIQELVPVVQYIRNKSDIFIMINFSLNKNGYTQAGLSAQRILKEASVLEEIDACGFNCGIGSGHMLKIAQEVRFPENKYIAILPNASYPEKIHNRLVFMENATYFNENMSKIRTLGVHMVGGCCGTTPRFIYEIAKQTINFNVPKLEDAKKTECEVIKPAESDVTINHSVGNKLLQLFETGKKVVAVELDPPYDTDCSKVITCAKALTNADIITMADSPMGRSRVDSILMSLKLSKETGHLVMPHISCRDKNMIAMRSTLLGAYIHGMRNCLFVTGDPVPNVSRINTTAVFDYNSIQLMNFVKEMNQEHFHNDPIVYGGALNQGRGLIDKVAERMYKKIEAGAQFFLTQPIYSKEDVERIAILKEKVGTKILCGIMPLVSYRNANFIKNEMTGIYVPDEIVARYSKDMSKEEAEWVGAEISNEMILELKDIADGYYFMLPFNRVSLMDKIQIQ